MKKYLFSCIVLSFLILMSACQSEKENSTEELWIYASLYKDTIADLTPRLKKAFPHVTFKWYQAGSGEIASKVNGELLKDNLQADVLISSDRFWYEEMANSGKLHAYSPAHTKKISTQLKHPQDMYHAVSLPVMVLCYNNEAISAAEAPKTFKELALPKWKGKFTTGSPLTSGTNFTTMAMLQKSYGWEYFQALKNNDTIAQGSSSSVIRRIQNKERPIGWVLLENILRFKGKDERLQIIFPNDGVVTHANIIAITKKDDKRELAERFTNWMFSNEGQEAMTRSFMYSPRIDFPAPIGAPSLEKILGKAFPWTQDFLKNVTKRRAMLKEKYTAIMFE